ncbi:hypothetical protein DORFOR_00624 [Dorea formicigenerans ATCC 27755]|uniref:Uncharacterized protein n=1 Tax=Dorea formicigenerans ATCC 27755 TaxID=411461 RepID=B0G303_9FIRM|nr:hypothetical protein DORFOR_00624 [Dorea formicigenerans ATCC 27755]
MLPGLINGAGICRRKGNAISFSIKINPNDSRYRLDLLIYLDFT